MKLFEEKPVVHRYEYAAEFIRDFQVEKATSSWRGNPYSRLIFLNFLIGVVVRYSSQYGQGEPTDLMEDGAS